MSQTVVSDAALEKRIIRSESESGGSAQRRVPAWRRWVLLTVVAAMIAPLLLGIFGGTASADDEVDYSSYSFYEISSNMTGMFSKANEPGSEDFQELRVGDENDGRFPPNPGSAGAFVGYLDASLMKDGFSDWIVSNLSGSSAAMSYDSLKLQESGDPGPYFKYAVYGAALNDMGFDGSSTGFGIGVSFIGGGIAFVLWAASYVVDFLFSMFITVLQFLNPFNLFYAALNVVNPELANGMVGGDIPSNWGGALSGLVSWIAEWYHILYNMSVFVILPLFFAALILGLFFFRSMNKGSALKKFLVRGFFIVFGIPLLGSMYTATLHQLDDTLDPSQTGATRMVMSSYVDFEKWALDYRLAMPNNTTVVWDVEQGSVTPSTNQELRETAYAVNGLSYGNLGNLTGDTVAAFSQAQYDAIYDGEDTVTSDFADVANMLWRYMSRDQVTASAFESGVQGRMNDRIDNLVGMNREDAAERILSWYEDGSEEEGPAAYYDDSQNLNPLIFVSDGSGTMDAGSSSIRPQFTTNGSPSECGFAVWAGDTDGAPRGCFMSPLAMYNYLNTDFDSTSLTVYSSENVMSEATRSMHNSVNAVGNGLLGFLIWLNTVSMLGSFAVIGFVYAFAMFFGAFRRLFQVVSAIPFATVGVLSSIVQVIVYTIALVLQTLGTIFLYMFVQRFLVSLPQIIEAPFAALMDGELGFIGGTITVIMSLGFSIVAIWGFVFVALRVRGSALKAMETGVKKITDRFILGDGAASGGPSMGGSGGGVLAGVGAGAGAAAANRAMTNMGNRVGGGSGGGRSGVGANGQRSVSTGAAGGADGSGPMNLGGTGSGPGGDGSDGDTLNNGSSGVNVSAGAGGAAGSGMQGGSSATNAQLANSTDGQRLGENVAENGLSLDGSGNGVNGGGESGADGDTDAAEAARLQSDQYGDGTNINDQYTDEDQDATNLQAGDDQTMSELHGDEHQDAAELQSDEHSLTDAAQQTIDGDTEADHLQADGDSFSDATQTGYDMDEDATTSHLDTNAQDDMSQQNLDASQQHEVEHDGDEYDMAQQARATDAQQSDDGKDTDGFGQGVATGASAATAASGLKGRSDKNDDTDGPTKSSVTGAVPATGRRLKSDGGSDAKKSSQGHDNQTRVNSHNPGGARPVAGTEKSDLWDMEGAAGRKLNRKIADKVVKDPEKRDKMEYRMQRAEGTTKSMKQGAAKGAVKGFVRGGPAGAATGAAKGAVTGVAKNERQHRKNVKAHQKDLKRSGRRAADPKPRQSNPKKSGGSSGRNVRRIDRTD